jgi:hypothetical protein
MSFETDSQPPIDFLAYRSRRGHGAPVLSLAPVPSEQLDSSSGYNKVPAVLSAPMVIYESGFVEDMQKIEGLVRGSSPQGVLVNSVRLAEEALRLKIELGATLQAVLPNGKPISLDSLVDRFFADADKPR